MPCASQCGERLRIPGFLFLKWELPIIPEAVSRYDEEAAVEKGLACAAADAVPDTIEAQPSAAAHRAGRPPETELDDEVVASLPSTSSSFQRDASRKSTETC